MVPRVPLGVIPEQRARSQVLSTTGCDRESHLASHLRQDWAIKWPGQTASVGKEKRVLLGNPLGPVYKTAL